MKEEDRIRAMELMLENHTRREMAEFMVHLDEAVEGLGKNNRGLAEAYRKALSDKTRIDKQKVKGVIDNLLKEGDYNAESFAFTLKQELGLK